MMYKFEVYSDDMVFTASFDPDSKYVFCSLDDIAIGLDFQEIKALILFLHNAEKTMVTNSITKV